MAIKQREFMGYNDGNENCWSDTVEHKQREIINAINTHETQLTELHERVEELEDMHIVSSKDEPSPQPSAESQEDVIADLDEIDILRIEVHRLKGENARNKYNAKLYYGIMKKAEADLTAAQERIDSVKRLCDHAPIGLYSGGHYKILRVDHILDALEETIPEKNNEKTI